MCLFTTAYGDVGRWSRRGVFWKSLLNQRKIEPTKTFEWRNFLLVLIRTRGIVRAVSSVDQDIERISEKLRAEARRRVDAGETISSIARDAKISRSALSRFLGVPGFSPGIELIDGLAVYLGLHLVKRKRRKA